MSNLLISKGSKPRKGFITNCKYCGKEVYCYPREIVNKDKNFFCNRQHQILFQKKNSFSCKCVTCGKLFKIQPCQVIYRNRKNCSRACKKIYVGKLAKEKAIKYGYTKHQLDRQARYSQQAIEWRKSVFERDNYTCQFCKIRGGKLEADHIKPFAYFPELRYELSNGRTLCRKCHDKTKISYKKMREIYLSGLSTL